MTIRALTEADRRQAAHVYVRGFLDEEIRPLMPRHLDRAEAIFAELIQPDCNSWVADSGSGEIVGLVLCQEFAGLPVALTRWNVYRRYLPLVAAVRAKVVANYLYRVTFPRDTVYLQSLVVDADWQGRGIAHELVEFVCGMAGQRGHTRVMLNLVEGNERARRLYQHLGFSTLETIRTGRYRYLVGWPSLDCLERKVTAT